MLEKALLVVSIVFGMQLALAGEISGVIELDKAAKDSVTATGSLFVFAKKSGSENEKGVPPIAVLRIANPQFPQKFSLTEANVMMPGTPFAGPLVISARYSPSGDAMDKSGPNGIDKKHAKTDLGEKNIKIILKK